MNHIDNQKLNLLLTLRLRQIHSNGYTGVSYDDLYRMFTEFVWRKGFPRRISELANDVLQTSDDAIIRWLATESKIKGLQESLEDYKKLVDNKEI